MAKKWSNRDLPGALHFVTGNVHRRKKIFLKSEACKAFLEEIHKLNKKVECRLICFVVMPDHFHLIVNPRDGGIRRWTGGLKSLSAKKLVEIFPSDYFSNEDSQNRVWQESFKDFPLWSGWMIWQKINYIHLNPLRANLVKSTADYKWSSFQAFYSQQPDPILQVEKDWWWPDDGQKLTIAMAEWEEELLKKYERQKMQRKRE